jgi:hypothetical protein
MPAHDRQFLWGLVGTVQGRLGWAAGEMNLIGEELDTILVRARWTSEAQFSCVSYVMRFGNCADDRVHARKNKRFGELEVSSQLAMTQLREVLLSRPGVRQLLCAELLRVLHWLESEYHLPHVPDAHLFLRSRGEI